MSSKIFSGSLAAAKESKLLNADRFNRMLECADGDSAFKIAMEGGFGGGATTLEAASTYERKALADFIKGYCPDKKMTKFLLCRADFLNGEALIKSKYLKFDVSDMLVDGGLIPTATLKEKIFKDDYSDLPTPLADALRLCDKMFVENTADGFLVNNAFVKALFDYQKTLASTPFLAEMLSYKIDATNLTACFRCNEDSELFEEMFLSGGTISKDRCLLLAGLSPDAFQAEIMFDSYKEFANKLYSETKQNKAPILAENDCDSFALKRLKEDRFNLGPLMQFLLFCLYKQNEITNVNVIVVGLNSGADRAEIKARLRECYEN